MSFSDTLNAKWFEVVENGVIVFAGPLEQCGDYVIRNSDTGNNGYTLTIRLCTF